LQAVYAINGGSFAGLADYKKIPMRELAMMINIHNAEVKRQNP
jgi:hypothetical protein